MLPKILIGCPIGYQPESGMLETFSEAVALHPSEGYASNIRVIAHRITNQARNMLSSIVIQGDWSHLFMLDDDMTYPAGTLSRLLQADKDIVAPFYVRKVRGFLPNAFTRLDGAWTTVWADDLKQVAAVGTGGILIKRKVLEALEPPWFAYAPYPEEANDVYKVQQRSEDVVFCDRAVAAGFEVWVEGRLKCGHIGKFVVTPGAELSDKPGYGSVKVEPYEPLDDADGVYGY